MKLVKVAIPILGMLVVLGIFVGSAHAWGYNAPPTGTLTVVDGVNSYFTSTVYFQRGYNVFQGVFPGWCVDTSVIMARGVPHTNTFYCSLNTPVLTNINWAAINYILNHKQGSVTDVQYAIWYFSNGVTPLDPTVSAMIIAALANPGYKPCTGQIVAIIGIPSDHVNAQDTIFEYTMCCCCCCPFG
jgi:hypothetical protein